MSDQYLKSKDLINNFNTYDQSKLIFYPFSIIGSECLVFPWVPVRNLRVMSLNQSNSCSNRPQFATKVRKVIIVTIQFKSHFKPVIIICSVAVFHSYTSLPDTIALWHRPMASGRGSEGHRVIGLYIGPALTALSGNLWHTYKNIQKKSQPGIKHLQGAVAERS